MQEGFEDGLPNSEYLEGTPDSQNLYGLSFPNFPNRTSTTTGRNAYSNKCLRIQPDNTVCNAIKTLSSSLGELYFRIYFKYSVGSAFSEVISLYASSTIMLSIYQTSLTGFDIKVRKSGSYAITHSFSLAENTWYKFDVYLKINASTGAYEVKLNDVSIKSESTINTGSSNISSIQFGCSNNTSSNNNSNLYFDDIALNDASGSNNNSWCGNGTIISLKPKGAGNKAQWDTCEGYANGESGTTTTNIKITAHGLSTNDVIYNKTRDAYRIITYVDADNFTVSSVTGQTTNDVILLYKNVATISATSGTSTNLVTIAGHTMQSGDVIVNTTRSNAIRRVIYVNGNNVYNEYATKGLGTLGSAVTSQASGDSIKTFAFTPYAISNHWESVSNQTNPSPKYSYIESTTSGDIDTFDMEELVADKALPAGLQVVAVSHNVYAQETGAGSQIKPVFRISGTDYEGDAQTLSSGTLQYQKIYETSPATSVAWTQSEVDALEAGVKLV